MSILKLFFIISVLLGVVNVGRANHSSVEKLTTITEEKTGPIWDIKNVLKSKIEYMENRYITDGTNARIDVVMRDENGTMTKNETTLFLGNEKKCVVLSHDRKKAFVIQKGNEIKKYIERMINPIINSMNLIKTDEDQKMRIDGIDYELNVKMKEYNYANKDIKLWLSNDQNFEDLTIIAKLAMDIYGTSDKLINDQEVTVKLVMGSTYGTNYFSRELIKFAPAKFKPNDFEIPKEYIVRN